MWIYVVLLVLTAFVALVADGTAFWALTLVGLYLGWKLVVMLFDDPRLMR